MIRRCSFVMAAVLALGSVALAQDKVDIRVRMNKGDRFAFSSQTVVRTQLKISAGPQSQDVNQTITDLASPPRAWPRPWPARRSRPPAAPMGR
jgi:hypothetical protein